MDRVPTQWFAGIGTVLFLAATAAFGGLATAAEPALPELGPGEEYRGEQLSLRIERAVLIDALPEAGLRPEEGQRVLVVIGTFENLWTEALPSGPGQSVSEAVRIERNADTAPDSVARFDDLTLSPWLQPQVPAQLALGWLVDDEEFTAGEELRLLLREQTLFTGSMVVDGQYWSDAAPAAIVTVVLDDVGAGAG